jgi:hypothetical protein
MKQYRITSSNFVPEGETGMPDTVMDSADLNRIKRLAGLGNNLLEEYTAGGADPGITTPVSQATDSHTMSPVGSNISTTGMEKRELEKKNHIKPGTPEWFKLWFSLPYLTGEKPVGDDPAPKIKRSND